METLKDIISSFKITSEDERTLLNSNEAPGAFCRVAECMLAGHFLVTDGQKNVFVYPTILEFYYHEEKKEGIKDPIVYHKNPKTSKTQKPLIPTGFLHNHVSGIDLTFEHENDGLVRASVLIREFRVEVPFSEPYDDVERNMLSSMKAFNITPGTNDEHSTRMYAALFSSFSIFGDGFNVRWEDGSSAAEVEFVSPRKNVYQYDINWKKTDVLCTRKWQARLKAQSIE